MVEELEELRGTIRHVINLLGSGTCKNDHCESCEFERKEAVAMLRLSIGLPAKEELNG